MMDVNAENLLLTSDSWDKYFEDSPAGVVNAICTTLRLGLDIRLDGKDIGGCFEFWIGNHHSDPRFYGIRDGDKYIILDALSTHPSRENGAGWKRLQQVKKGIIKKVALLKKAGNLPDTYHTLAEEGFQRFQDIGNNEKNSAMRTLDKNDVDNALLDAHDDLRKQGKKQGEINDEIVEAFGSSAKRRLNTALDKRGRSNIGGHLKKAIKESATKAPLTPNEVAAARDRANGRR